MTSSGSRDLNSSWVLPGAGTVFAGKAVRVRQPSPGRGLAVRYAADVLEAMGVPVATGNGDDTRGSECSVLLVDGSDDDIEPGSPGAQITRIRLWDFQVGRAGNGFHASAVAGVSWVLGVPGKPPLALPGGLAERICGAMGAYLTLGAFVRGRGAERDGGGPGNVFDVSCADVLRAFADQNFGNVNQIRDGWRRNGRFAPEHGAIYPQGYFACRDGYVAVVARSRKDWLMILRAFGDPEWSLPARMRDPFALAQDPGEVDPFMEDELSSRTRDELLALALDTGATFAPVFSTAEARERRLARAGFESQAAQAAKLSSLWTRGMGKGE